MTGRERSSPVEHIMTRLRVRVSRVLFLRLGSSGGSRGADSAARKRRSDKTPDLLDVLVDGTITAEVTSTSNAHDAATSPLVLILPDAINLFEAVQVERKIVSNTVVIVAAPERIDKRTILITRAEHAVLDGLENVVETLIDPAWRTAADASDLVLLGTKDEDVLSTDVVHDLDVGTIKGTDEKTTVHGELHVASTRGLGTSSGDVLAEITGRDNLLSTRNVVVGNEHNLEEITNAAIGVDNICNSDDQLDDELGDIVASSSLTCKDDGLGDNVLALLRRHLLDGKVTRHDTKDVHELTLVLVDTLDLDIEHGIGVDVDVDHVVDLLGQTHLVLHLSLTEGSDELRGDHVVKLLKLVEVGNPG